MSYVKFPQAPFARAPVEANADQNSKQKVPDLRTGHRFALFFCGAFVFERLALGWPGDSQRESGQFARIESQNKTYFHNVRAIHANHLKPVICNF